MIKDKALEVVDRAYDVLLTKDHYNTLDKVNSQLIVHELMLDGILKSDKFNEEQKKEVEQLFFIMKNKLLDKKKILQDMEILK